MQVQLDQNSLAKIDIIIRQISKEVNLTPENDTLPLKSFYYIIDYERSRACVPALYFLLTPNSHVEQNLSPTLIIDSVRLETCKTTKNQNI